MSNAWRTGDVLGGRYRFERILGEGGTSVVALVHDASAQRNVALKIFRDTLEDEVLARFVDEAKTAAKIDHDGIARIIEVVHVDGVGPCAVMELLEGKALVHAGVRPLDVDRAVSYVRRASAVVDSIHAKGFLHGDLKPASFFLTADGIKLLGGWAPVDTTELRRGKAVSGSPLYMAPEQLKQSALRMKGSDVWALGVVLYELLTGRVPFNGETLSELFVAILSKTPTPPRALRSEIPADVDAIVMRCLERDVNARLRTAGEIATALARFAS